jgi:GT2 family glycosyltransferase
MFNRLGIIVVTHNRPESLARLVASLPDDAHIYIVANDPCEETRRLLWTTTVNKLRIDVKEVSPGVGYAGAVDLGLYHFRILGSVDKVLILTDDMQIAPRSIKALMDALFSNGVAISGPTVYDNDTEKIWSAGGYVSRLTGLPRRYPRAWRGTREVDLVCGCCMMIDIRQLRDSLWMWEAHLGFYMEEADFCTKMRRIGFKVVCVSAATAWHDVGRASLDDRLKARYFARNNQWYCWRHLSLRTAKVNALFYRLLSVVLFILGRREAAKGLLEGLRDFQAPSFGMIKEERKSRDLQTA